MKSIITATSIIFFGCTLMAFRCGKPAQDNCNGVMCTQEFRSIVLTPNDNSGKKVLLSGFEVINTSNMVVVNSGTPNPDSTITVLTDAHQNLFPNLGQTVSFQVVAKVNGTTKGSREISVMRDCCHIQSDQLFNLNIFINP